MQEIDAIQNKSESKIISSINNDTAKNGYIVFDYREKLGYQKYPIKHKETFLKQYIQIKLGYHSIFKSKSARCLHIWFVYCRAIFPSSNGLYNTIYIPPPITPVHHQLTASVHVPNQLNPEIVSPHCISHIQWI